MCDEHAVEWGRVFCEWMQKVLNDLSDGVSNAFSVFVHGETHRNFADVAMLVVPGCSGGQEAVSSCSGGQ